jgi:hypothetical protein
MGMPDYRILETPALNHYDCSRFTFGDRWLFGIECEVQASDLDPWGEREPFGSFWFWIGGHSALNPSAAEQLNCGFGPLERVSSTTGNRKASDIPGSTNFDKLDFVIWVTFGEDEEYDAQRWGNANIEELRRLDLSRFEAIPRGGSPFHSGWEGILIENGETETFIWREWRHGIGGVHELSLPLGTFAGVADAARKWFVPFRNSRVGEIKPSEGKAVYVPRRADIGRFVGLL